MQLANQHPGQDSNEDFADELDISPSGDEKPVEGDWNDEDDEDFDDKMDFEEDLREIRTGDDIGEPDPEDDDHLPEEEGQ
ncbi:hypothetical protein EWM62_09460 [Mucilaginibacter terrigena]|uniref:Uncharacterized protein n=1 Tax=Mucilaginibacter terrigena TaxID=2492395 RepID=A0A4Q5LMM1_9SPHI|nr:hypothetical protein [Mucilaginibacter terrigena]RYU90857.1 hypothetical protein EWM62_09460 [Mucilaginibacter terrigena]